jgi:regulator of protease activity HflC (stomatin/prohibitin superfamily)
VGQAQDVVEKLINPAVEEVLKAVLAKYTAEEIITKRGEVKNLVDHLLANRLLNYHVKVDDVSLVHVHFSENFAKAVEAKQIAEQEAKKAGFAVLKAKQEAEAKINLAHGEAEAQRIIHETLTTDILQKKALENWDGKLPVLMEKNDLRVFDISDLVKVN